MKKIIILLILLCAGCSNQTFDENDIIIDVRTFNEYKQQHIKNAINIPVDNIEKEIKEEVPDKDAKIYVYCKSGTRSSLALSKLEEMGYNNVENLGGISNKYELEGE